MLAVGALLPANSASAAPGAPKACDKITGGVVAKVKPAK